ncbi:MAG: histone family protein [Promethearchaeota archaeon]
MARKKRVFAWSPLRSLMKDAGAQIVSRDAVGSLMDYLEARAKKLTESAIKLAKHSKRKKVTRQDMQLAIDIGE